MDRLIAWYAGHKKWNMLAPAFVSLLLLTPNLGETYLWTDETDTAAIARNILRSGLPLVYDGRNLIQYYPSVHNDDYIQVGSPLLTYYITAASFGIFGISTASARLPFVILGIVVVLVFPSVVRRLTDDSWTRTVAPLVLATSVPFLLYFRQCRYYGLMIAATLWLVWAYLRLIESDEKRNWNAAHLTLAAIVLFHSHYFVCLGTLVGLGIHWISAYRKRIPWHTIVASGSVFAVFTVPWILYGLGTTLPVYQTRSQLGDINLGSFLHRTAHFLGRLCATLGEDFAPPLLLMIFILLLIGRQHRWWRRLGCTGCVCAMGVVLNVPGMIYCMSFCVFLAVIGWAIRYLKGQIRVTPFSIVWMLPLGLIITLAFISETDQVRYLTGAVPFVYIGLVWIFGLLRIRFPRLSVVLLLVFLYTNLFRSAPAYALSLIPTSAMQTGIALAESNWSRQLGIPPLLPEERNWYHRMAVIDGELNLHRTVHLYPYEYLYELTHDYDGPVEGITKYLTRHGSPQDTVKVDSDAVGLIFYMDMTILPEHLFKNKSIHAEWVILRASNWHNIPDEFIDYLRRRYDRIELPYPDIPWENRPELSFHHFRLPQDWPPVVVYRRRAPDL